MSDPDNDTDFAVDPVTGEVSKVGPNTVIIPPEEGAEKDPDRTDLIPGNEPGPATEAEREEVCRILKKNGLPCPPPPEPEC